MTKTLWIGTTASNLDLTDRTKYHVLFNGFQIPPDEGLPRWSFPFRIEIVGATSDAMWDNYRALEAVLRRGRRAFQSGDHSRIQSVAVQGDTTGTVYVDLTDGRIRHEPWNAEFPWLRATLELETLPYFRGAAYTPTTTPTSATTLTNGSTCYVDIDDIPGDLPAYIEATITDVSTGSAIINEAIIAVATTDDLDASEYQPVHNLTPSGSGSSTAVTDSIGGTVSELTAGGDWTTIAHVDGPDLDATKGRHDILLRARDEYQASDQVTLDSLAQNLFGNGVTAYGASGSGSTSTATLEADWSQPTKRGSTLVAFVGWRGSATITFTGWTLRDSEVQGSGGTATRVAIYSIDASAPREGTETLTFSGATVGELFIIELPDMDITATDVTGSGTAAAATSVVAATGVLSEANMLTMSVAMSSANSTPTVATSPIGGAFLYRANTGFAVGRRSTNATTSIVYTTTGNSGNWASCAIAFEQRVNAAPDLTAGTYTVRVAPINSGVVSVASDPLSLAVSSNFALIIPWTEPTAGAPDEYRVYWQRGGGAWSYVDTGNTNEAFILVTETGASAGDPVLESDLAYVRLLISLPSGATPIPTAPVQFPVGLDIWRWFWVAAEVLPPVPALDGAAQQNWSADVQVKRQTSTTHAVQVDALATLPCPDGEGNSQARATYTGLALATKYDWIIATRRDGHTFAFLQVIASATDAGHLDGIGELRGGPGNARLYLLLAGAGLASEVTNLKAKVALSITPRYLGLRGS